MDLAEFHILSQNAAVCVFSVITITFIFFGGSLGVGLLAMVFLPAKYVNPELIVKTGTVIGFFVACATSLYFLAHPPIQPEAENGIPVIIHVPPEDDVSFGSVIGQGAYSGNGVPRPINNSVPGIRVIGPVFGALKSDDQQPSQDQTEDTRVK